MHLVAPVKDGRLHAVLVSIPQQIGGYAQDLLDLLDDHWAGVEVPVAFQAPTDPGKQDKWQKCLLACEDYFGASSREYRLLPSSESVAASKAVVGVRIRHRRPLRT
jgi:hypothetical protein